jgi:hypothetical protein
MKSILKLFLTIILLLNTFLIFSQTVEILNQSDKKFASPTNDFAYIENKSDTTKFEFVAAIKATDNNKTTNIQTLYNSILDKAKSIGANCFKLNSYLRNDTTNDVVLILDTYFGNDSSVNDNFAVHEKNTVFIFCNDKINESETFNFKINGDKKKIKSGTYYKEIIKEGQEIKLNKGGFTGMTMWFTWKKGKPATFLTLTGFGLGGGPIPYGTIGVSFNTGRIYPIDEDLGTLLAQILKEDKSSYN